MDLELAFVLAHVPALIGWGCLIFFPAARGVRPARIMAAALAAGYLLIFLLSGSAASVLAADYSLRGVAAFFDHPMLQLLGWVHYLAFDLWVGSWEADEAGRLGIGRWVLIPCLILTLMLGPIGLLLFLLLRASRGTAAARQVPPGLLR